MEFLYLILKYDMILEFKTQFSNTAAMLNCEFTTKNHGEYEEFVQNFNFSRPSINFFPIRSYSSEITIASTTRYKGNFEVYFLQKFTKSDNFEDTKDVIIDEMILLSQAFYNQLNANQYLLFDMPLWTWRAEIIRQYTANLICGVKVLISFDTACNRLDGSAPVPSLPVVIRSTEDGGYIVYGQSADSPFIIPDIRYQLNGGGVVQLPYTDEIIPIEATAAIEVIFNGAPLMTITDSPFNINLRNTAGTLIGEVSGGEVIINTGLG